MHNLIDKTEAKEPTCLIYFRITYIQGANIPNTPIQCVSTFLRF